jgi:DNA-nicking Smr family endonuclease
MFTKDKRNNGRMRLDLHGIKHRDVPEVLDSFVWDCIKFNIEQAEIITGNSTEMKTIVKNILMDYGLEPCNFFNFGGSMTIDFIKF